MSKNYSIVERKLAAFFRRFPTLKKKIKSKYQYLNYLFYRSKDRIISDSNFIEVEYKEGYETFFGYYDKSPMNRSEDKILFQATKYPTTKLPNPNEPIAIVVKCNETGLIVYEDLTRAYNWQQGAKPMWLSDNEIIYNFYDIDEGVYKSKIVNLSTKQVKLIGYPNYDATAQFALTLNFDTLNKLRPDYGYREVDSRFVDLGYAKDGIFKIDLENENKLELIISIEELCKIDSKDSMAKAKHKVNHIMLSPECDKFIFLHRWFEDERKFDRLLVYDLLTREIRVLLDDEMVSHCFWKDNNSLVAFATTKKLGDRYYEIDFSNDSVIVKELEFEGSNSLGDGHPNVFNKKEMLIDTYPDRARMKNLYVVNLETSEISKVASLFESFKFKGETRCDLHPRWSPKGNYIFIDSVHNNETRKLYINKRNS